MIIEHGGYKCRVRFDKYADNGNTAILLIGADGHYYEGEMIAVATANGKPLPTDIVGIKTWSENKGIDDSLIKGNIIEPALLDMEPTGFVEILHYRLTDEAIQYKNSERW